MYLDHKFIIYFNVVSYILKMLPIFLQNACISSNAAATDAIASFIEPGISAKVKGIAPNMFVSKYHHQYLIILILDFLYLHDSLVLELPSFSKSNCTFPQYPVRADFAISGIVNMSITICGGEIQAMISSIR